MKTSQTSIDLSKEIQDMNFGMTMSEPFFNIETKQFDYKITLGRYNNNATVGHASNAFTIDYHCGAGWIDENNRPVRPTLADVMHCLILDIVPVGSTFEDWCSDLGYDSDSRKAYDIFQACDKNGRNVKKLLGDDLEKVSALLQDY